MELEKVDLEAQPKPDKLIRKEIDSSGTICYNNNLNQWHREDGPAIECADGTKAWYRNGQYHREDGPAVEYADGSRFWYLNGQRHREDGPACEYASGTKYWFINDKQIFCKTNEKFLKLMKLKSFW